MDSWQGWVSLVAGTVISYMLLMIRQEKTRVEKFRETTNERLVGLSERVVRVESDVVTEREVRELLKEFIVPFVTSIEHIEKANNSIAKDVTDIRVAIAKMSRDETS